MATFDTEATEDIVAKIKNDLAAIDTTIDFLIKEASGRPSPALKYHDLATPLGKLFATKQKYIDQLLKILVLESDVNVDEDIEFDLDSEYGKFEKIGEKK